MGKIEGNSRRYDSALQMFVEETREPDLRRLTFLRWLVDNNRLEHRAAGPASGDLVAVAAAADLDKVDLASAFPRTRSGAVNFNRPFRAGWMPDGQNA